MVRSLKNPKKAKRKSKGSKKGEGSSSNSGPSVEAKVWQPGVDKLEEGEELQCDPSAYNSLHAFHIGWPCLSFDILRDSLGLVRTEFPHTVYCVAGTQAEKSSWNSIGIFKLSNISGKRRELVPKINKDGSDMDSESSDSDEDNEEEGGRSGSPVLQLRKVSHEGGVNRIRAMRQNPHICASWADTGHVQVWDFSSHLKALVESEAEAVHGGSTVFNQAPLVKFTGHKDEGYAIDWSPLVAGRLVSGDCKNCIHLWEPASDSTWNIDTNPFVGHTASVEDLQVYFAILSGYSGLVLNLIFCSVMMVFVTYLQWSPTEPYVFASCSVDGNIAIWDIRLGKTPAVSIKAHKADVNVITWNRVWDLSLERDEEEEAEFKAKTKEQVNAPTDLPPQLLFVHQPYVLRSDLQGQKDLKELHWHSQIPGMLISTAADGYNILMPSNIETPLPPNDA
ncbi:hypothetical protein DH2020_048020 [Rehmannia glutinosa]|uniref:Histone-binding protein RBBP4-like N-terminal domain-containing protein n=1 Tax=Rehmannia glutinosa TaxID=99300 RepID=A0ABR0U6X9_REHGL